MAHVLDNMIWSSITTGNRNISTIDGDVGCYDPQIAPFAAAKEWNEKNWENLHALLPAGRKIAASYYERKKPDEAQWEILQEMECYQMVYEKPTDSFTTGCSSLIVPLGTEHVPQMLELTALTKPGPFFEKTILFGNYFGIFVDGRLAAMTGQRMNPVPYMEVSAVCTHPDFRGKGYAKSTMLHVMKLILENSSIPFLHVLTGNTSAIRLYESIGYTIREKRFIDMIKRI